MNKIKISLFFNIIIFALTIVSVIIMFTGFTFMHGPTILEARRFDVFKFFTVDSNILMGIIAIIFAFKEKQLLNKKIKKIPVQYYVLKLAGTVGVALTFLTVFLYLARIVDGGVVALLQNSNLFLHLIIPVMSMFTFVLFENSKELKFKHVIYGIIPMTIYAIYYVTNIIIHAENGVVSTVYDWYHFSQGGVQYIIIVLPIMLIFTYVISLVLYFLNKVDLIKSSK